MIKLRKLLDEIEIKLNNPQHDPSTNSITHDVEYIYKYKHNYKELDTFIHNLSKLAAKEKPAEPHLEDLLHVAKNLRNRYARYLNNRQPGWREK